MAQTVDVRVLGNCRGETVVEGTSIGKHPVVPSSVATSLSASGMLSSCCQERKSDFELQNVRGDTPCGNVPLQLNASYGLVP